MNYQEMVDSLIGMDEQQRRQVLINHWEIAFSDSFIAYVQGQVEEARKMVNSGSEIEKIVAGIKPELVDVLRTYGNQHLKNLLNVWNSMSLVYQLLQKQSELQGNKQGMVNHGNHRVMPRGVNVTNAVHCYRCGSQAVDQGLCNGCLTTQQNWEQDDLDYQDQLDNQQRQNLDYQRIQDDQIYHQQQQDFNTYTNYYNDY